MKIKIKKLPLILIIIQLTVTDIIIVSDSLKKYLVKGLLKESKTKIEKCSEKEKELNNLIKQNNLEIISLKTQEKILEKIEKEFYEKIIKDR